MVASLAMFGTANFVRQPERRQPLSWAILAAWGLAGLPTKAAGVNQLPTGFQSGLSSASINALAEMWAPTTAGPAPQRAEQLGFQAQDLLTEVRSRIGLNITQLAGALRVERPTIYAWLRGEQPNQSNRSRLEELAGVSELWAQLSVAPGSASLSRRIQSGETVLEALSAGTIDKESIRQVLIAPSAVKSGASLDAASRAKALGISKDPRSGESRENFLPRPFATDLGENQ